MKPASPYHPTQTGNHVRDCILSRAASLWFSTMARRPDLERFARAHDLKIGTIADLIRYRLKNELGGKIYDNRVDTEYGAFRLCCYEDHVNKNVHVALLKGDLNSALPPLVRVHINDFMRDRSSACAARNWMAPARRDSAGWPASRRVLFVVKARGNRRGTSWDNVMQLDAKPATAPPSGRKRWSGPTESGRKSSGSWAEAHASAERLRSSFRVSRPSTSK